MLDFVEWTALYAFAGIYVTHIATNTFLTNVKRRKTIWKHLSDKDEWFLKYGAFQFHYPELGTCLEAIPLTLALTALFLYYQDVRQFGNYVSMVHFQIVMSEFFALPLMNRFYNSLFFGSWQSKMAHYLSGFFGFLMALGQLQAAWVIFVFLYEDGWNQATYIMLAVGIWYFVTLVWTIIIWALYRTRVSTSKGIGNIGHR